ncbi:MAG: LppP/LprE family lipoprotein [Pseudobdellovibrionaceae bacterium]
MKLKAICISLISALLLLAYLLYHDNKFDSQNAGRSIVDQFISSKENALSKEGAKLQGAQEADLNEDGKQETIIVWTLFGSTYWHNNLTILSDQDGKYEFLASKQLIGEAKLSKIEGDTIYVDQKIYADKDPICCPSVEKQIKYHWDGKNIEQLK